MFDEKFKNCLDGHDYIISKYWSYPDSKVVIGFLSAMLIPIKGWTIEEECSRCHHVRRREPTPKQLEQIEKME